MRLLGLPALSLLLGCLERSRRDYRKPWDRELSRDMVKLGWLVLEILGGIGGVLALLALAK